ncbi:lytic transglycosylase domain-containing protein [Candidatus Pacearchaeota archaeon]|nr:lytic transglycosylase domain-containing protein [Candidatus Pacearchaeota archaeon]
MRIPKAGLVLLPFLVMSQISSKKIEIFKKEKISVEINSILKKSIDLENILEEKRNSTILNFINSPEISFLLINESVQYLNLEAIAEHHPASKPFLPLVVDSVEKHQDIFYLDPLVVLGLIYAESNFDSNAVSIAGAAGLMQIIPETAKGLGLKIYEGNMDIYKNLKENRRRVVNSFNSATNEGRRGNYNDAIKWFREYNSYSKKADALFREYKRTLLENKDLDERLNPEKSIDAGVRYLAILAKLNRNTPYFAELRDIIAAYNFGGENAAIKWTLPTIREPLNHANKVSEFYRRFKPMTENSILSGAKSSD